MELRITRWKRYGHDRWYANLSDGTPVACADAKTGDITVLRAEYSDDVIAALTWRLQIAPHPAPTVAKDDAESTPELPPLTVADDLSVHRPGKRLQDRLDDSGPSAWQRSRPYFCGNLRNGIPGVRGLAGEKRVGAELDRLRRHGWQVLHSIPLANDVDLDHLLIGPGGVFSINTKYHQGRVVWVGDDSVKVDHGKPAPYARKSRAEARRVARSWRPTARSLCRSSLFSSSSGSPI
ncbi:nuclease-related domain-containing protein [Streptomyces sp. BPPL-273]|uniref:nuclease-related domain-containing protein n=1 Tax=Streptomyces sp. BPPL-273 TaxID=2987533 RepID=UPI0024AEDE9D|nr:nuclease-related domain-containing protein [Streptomyces sp. BPPL-273]WHM30790.1 nuclease-related domain-containing protein [Streptomyces sp. BPPL-273]